VAERELAIIVRARDLATRTLKGVNSEVNKLGKHATRGIGQATDTLKTLGTVAGGVAVAGLAASVKAAADFESQMNTINTVAAKTPEELAKIGDGIRQIAKDTGTPLEELTQGFYDLVSAGVAADQAQRTLAASNRLAIGGLATAAEGVDLITTALNGFGVAAKDQGRRADEFADIFAKAIERGKVTAADLAATFAQVGPIAHAQGIEIREIAAGYAQLTAKGVPAAEAATQMRAAMISLVRTTGPLEKLQKKTGHVYSAIASKKGLVAAFEQLRKDAAKAGVPLIDLVGRQEALQFAINTTGKELPGYNANLEAMGEATGTAARQMGERQKGLNAELSKLGALARDAGITIGEKLLPKLTPLAERVVNFLNTHQADISAFGDKIASGFDKAAQFAEKIDWKAIGSGLQTGAEWAGKLIDFFNTMPDDVKSTIVALAGLNKLSGGAISGVVGELGKGLIKGVLGMTAGVVNIKAGVVTGVGGGTPGAPGAPPVPVTTPGSGPGLLDMVKTLIPLIGISQAIGPDMPRGGQEAANQAYIADLKKLVELGRANEVVNSRTGQTAAQALAELGVIDSRLQTGVAGTNRINDHLQDMRDKETAQITATQLGLRQVEAAENRAATTTAAASRAAGAVAAGGGLAAASAIKNKDLSVTVNTNVSTSLSVRDLQAREEFRARATTHVV
jgi:TP901 family phage tail tape measure protein